MSGIRRRLLYAKPKEIPNYLCFTALEDGTFTFTYGSDVAGDSTSVSYSLDGNNWITLTNISGQEVSITTPTIQAGGNVYWKGTNTRMAVGDAANKYSWFSSTGRFDVSGDLQSILYDEDFEGKPNTQWGTLCCFCSLFLNCTKLVNSKDLLCNAKFGNGRFYKRMFMGCSSLISTPIFVDEFNKGVGSNFSAETFMELYKDCTSLVNPNWQFPLYNPTNASGIYRGMFENTGVLEARFQDSSKPLCSNIFNAMYRNCKNLTSINNLPWTSLSGGCYAYLFQGCTSLQQAPALPANDLGESSYLHMFDGCTSLQQVPDIRITSLNSSSLESMFNGCTSLVHCPIKSLPAQVAYSSHRSLFDGCTSLVDVCDFPAETNAAICYAWMLRNTKVTYIKMLLISISGNSIIGNWVSGVPSSGIFVKHIDAQWTTTGTSGVPTNWTVIYYDPALDKYYLDQQRQTECDDHGNPLVNPNYKIVQMEIEIYGKYQNPSSNTLSDNASYCTTYYYELEDFDSVSLFPETIGAYSFVYDENYNRLGSVSNINNKNIKSVYPTAKYVRFSGDTNNNMKNPFMVFYNTTNYVQSEYGLPKTSNIKLFKPEIAIRGKYLPATGVETNMGNYSISEYYEIVADRFQPYLNSNRDYCHAYDANEEWLFNLSTNTSIKGRDANATYIRISEETARMETASYFGVMYNFENVI